MKTVLLPLLETLIDLLRSRVSLQLELLALRQQLKSCTTYYHEARTHLSLDKQRPVPRLIQDPDQESIVAIPHLGGLHHEYRRAV